MIQGERYCLRHIREVDLPTYFEAISGLANRGEYISHRIKSPANLRKEFLENGFSTDDHERFLIIDHRQAMVGEVSHFNMRAPACREIGYWLYDEAQRGRGVMSEAVALLSDYLFKSRAAINRLEILSAVGNLGSQRVAQKCGYTKEGVLRQYLFSAGQYHDIAVYSLLRQEWQPGINISVPG